jgi:P-type Ca2+ transporter type 2C
MSTATPAAPEGTAPAVGLTSVEANRRLEADGPNEIHREPATSPWAVLGAQFKGAMIWLLLGASAVSAALGEVAEAAAIGAIVLLNAIVGFFQEYRAARAVQALRAMTAPRARVLRDGSTATIPAAEVVVGDTLVLEAGDIVPADARLRVANALRINEAALTGESAPVQKRIAPVASDARLAERTDCIFMGTAVSAGTGSADVIATGMRTELGKIAHLLAGVEQATTPLQRRLERVGRTLLYLCLGIVVVVAALGFLRGLPPIEILLSSVSLAVAAVPEGLAAVVTVALALGIQRMAARHVLIRRLASVETLGCATVICTDKTGTLTTGVMVVRELWGGDHEALLFGAAACSDAELAADERSGTGDPTELAILMAAASRGIDRKAIESERPRLAVEPFDADTKRMSIRRADGRLYLKGAVEVVLPLCRSGTANAIEANSGMARLGLRVLAVAVGDGPGSTELQLLGLIGIADPPRTEAIAAVALARGAGIRTVMITGDHPVTAEAIGRELGILRVGDSPAEVVHARATPEDKLRIVRGWKARGEVVAMTGDGVNDAPALREAHIGIAMGRTGTEVTREASDMILSDDNFASIVAAVQEGRGIYDNIQKTLVYLLAGNVGELAVMLTASVVGLPLPLLPLQLLWINLVTDGLPALALVADPMADDLLRRPPRKPDEAMLGRPQWITVVSTGLLQAVVTLSVYSWALEARGLSEARNLAFSVIVFSELFRSFAARSTTRLFWEVGAFTNLRLVGIVLLSGLLQIGLHHIPFTQRLLGTSPLSLADCALSVALGLIPVSVLECWKLLRRFRATVREAGD